MREEFPSDKIQSFIEGVRTYKKDSSIFDFIKCIHEVLKECIQSSDYLIGKDRHPFFRIGAYDLFYHILQVWERL